jgi:hypothetical protein
MSRSHTQAYEVDWFAGARRVAIPLEAIGVGTFVYVEGVSESSYTYAIIHWVQEGTGYFRVLRLPDLREVSTVFKPAYLHTPDVFMRVPFIPEVTQHLAQCGGGVDIQACFTAALQPRITVITSQYKGQRRARIAGTAVYADGITLADAVGNLVVDNPTRFHVQVHES